MPGYLQVQGFLHLSPQPQFLQQVQHFKDAVKVGLGAQQPPAFWVGLSQQHFLSH